MHFRIATAHSIALPVLPNSATRARSWAGSLLVGFAIPNSASRQRRCPPRGFLPIGGEPGLQSVCGHPRTNCLATEAQIGTTEPRTEAAQGHSAFRRSPLAWLKWLQVASEAMRNLCSIPTVRAIDRSALGRGWCGEQAMISTRTQRRWDVQATTAQGRACRYERCGLVTR
jgi:hypothetical protein